MKRGAGKWIFPAAAVLGIWAVAQCSEEQAQQTELLLTITSDVPVTEVEIRARNIANEDDTINEAMGSRDIIADPLLLLITPSSIIQDRFLVHAKGYLNGELIVAAADVYEFVPNQRVEATLTMTRPFAENDTDGDGFEDCNHVGCDCDDTNAAINPFTEELCSDRVDNNCSGLPINEGCPCRLTDPPVWCTVLTEEFQDLAGIGACTLGTLECIDDGNGDEFGVLEKNCDGGNFTVEVEGNEIDDDCDGTVDEGSPCDELATPYRDCFLGQINTASEPDRIANLPHARPVGECSVGRQNCNRGQWGPCENEVRPQRDTQSHVGWIELPADSDAGIASQCDGLDNDCDGQWDEEPYFDGDDDGYTICGTDRVNGGLYSELIDCNDDPSSDGASINPGATEICGNTVDEDCRCDHGDPATQIGSPVRNVDQSTNCLASQTYLNCAMLPRSDKPTDHGVCGDGSDGTTAYYHGYFGNTPTDKGCYTCDEQWGVSCSAASQLCATKDEDCAECNAGTPTGLPDEPRPYCTLPGCSEADCPSTEDEGGTVVATGCTGTEPPVWVPVADSDPNGDCPQPGNAVECTGYYCDKGDGTGVADHGCYEKTDPTPAEVDCIGSQSCEVAADLCTLDRPCEQNPIAPVDADGNSLTCVEVESGCYGTTRPNYRNQANNSDWFDECNDSFTCSTDEPQDGGGPFYSRAYDDTPGNNRDDPECHYRADVPDSWCNGNGACQSRADACTTSGEGAAVSEDGETGPDDRPLCRRPLTDRGCGLTADGLGNPDPLATPQYDVVTKGTDPYDDCTDGAIERTCNDNDTCHRLQGEQCDLVNECEPGLYCADGYCCNSECLGPCQSCDSAETDGPNGVCSDITDGTDPDALCNGDGSQPGFACYSGSCATICSPICSIDAGHCQAGYYCDNGGNCAPLRATGEQSDPACAGAVSCSPAFAADGFCCNNDCGSRCWSCARAYTGVSDGQCSAITPGTDPYNDCDGEFACNGGACATDCSACSIDESRCLDNHYCNSGGNGCLPLLDDGTPPDSTCGAVSCTSTIVADGVCCENACGGECQSCAVAGHLGACWPYTGRDDAGTPSCTGDDSFCCSGTCVNPAGTPSEYGESCGFNDCSGGTWSCTGSSPHCSSFDSPCNGYCVGDTPYNNAACTADYGATCAGSPDTACAVCIDCQINGGVAGCSTNYAEDEDDPDAPGICNGTNTCDGQGHCLRRDGEGCATDDQCASGFCRDGYCCADTCGDPCRSCDGSETGTAFGNGVCGVVIDGTDPRGDCDGGGSQPGLACNGGSCATGCTGCASTECETAGFYCHVVATVGTCTARQDNGATPDSTCGAVSCSSGSVADGVCCDTACDVACYSCAGADNTGGDGVCSFFDTIGNTDTAPTALCDSDGTGCVTNGCACDAAGSCLGAPGSTTCTDGAQCLSGTCDQASDPDECTSL